MKCVIGERYIAPKAAVVVGLSFLFLAFIGLGVFLSVMAHNTYVSEMDLYEIELFNYQHGYSYIMPTKPTEPIWKYLLYNGLAVVIGAVVCGLLFYSYGLEGKGVKEVIIYDDAKQSISVYKKSKYINIPLKDITNIERLIVPGGVYTGNVYVPIMTPTNNMLSCNQCISDKPSTPVFIFSAYC